MKSNFSIDRKSFLEELQMENTIIGIGIGIIIAALAIEPHMIVQYGYSVLPMIALAGTSIVLVLFAL
jgi:hypothetical protein